MELDALQVGEAYYILNVSAGISSQAMRKTEPEQKRRFGILAYVWTIARQLAGYEPHRFNLSLDGHQVQVRATEILVSNGTLLDEPPFPLGPPEYFNDGQFDVYILTARNLLDYLRVAWYLLLDRKSRNRELRKYTVNDRIFIDAVGRPQPVQADGELIGQTPVEIGLVTDAVRAIVPPLSQDV
jgi:diacylglycerol kinase family enzyme